MAYTYLFQYLKLEIDCLVVNRMLKDIISKKSLPFYGKLVSIKPF